MCHLDPLEFVLIGHVWNNYTPTFNVKCQWKKQCTHLTVMWETGVLNNDLSLTLTSVSYTYCIVEIGCLGSVQDILVHLPLWKLGLVCASALTISVMDGARCDALPDMSPLWWHNSFFDGTWKVLHFVWQLSWLCLERYEEGWWRAAVTSDQSPRGSKYR